MDWKERMRQKLIDAGDIGRSMETKRISETIIEVTNTVGETFCVNIETNTCSCKFFELRRTPCIHIRFAQ